MRTREEIFEDFVGDMGEAFSGDMNSRRDVDRVVAECNREVHDAFRKETKAITDRWKEGFAALKVENDTWQENSKGALKDALAEVKRIAQFSYDDLHKKY